MSFFSQATPLHLVSFPFSSFDTPHEQVQHSFPALEDTPHCPFPPHESVYSLHSFSEVRQSEVEKTVPRYCGTGDEVGAGRPSETEDETRATEEEEARAAEEDEARAAGEEEEALAEAEECEADLVPRDAEDAEAEAADLVAEAEEKEDAAGSEGIGSCFFCRATSSG